MNGKSLYDFYENVLLPQFGIKNVDIEWVSSEDIGPDETVHYFSTESEEYALIFEDFGGLGSSEEFVKENVKLKRGGFEYVIPTSYSDFSPSYPNKFATPYQYCANVTGMFTLVKL